MDNEITLHARAQIQFLRTNDVDAALRVVAAQCGLALTMPQVATLFTNVRDWTTVLEDLHSGLRVRMIQLAQDEGFVEGTFKQNISGWQVEVRQRANVDAKTLEARIRSKGKNPQTYMTPEVSYKVSPAGLALLLSDGVMTPDELDTCRLQGQYTVMAPKKVGTDE